MSPELHQALLRLVAVVEDQERAFQAARQAPNEFFLRGKTLAQCKANDPRVNTKAGARVAADKEVVIAARELAAIVKEEKL